MTKNRLKYILRAFFANSSGHPVEREGCSTPATHKGGTCSGYFFLKVGSVVQVVKQDTLKYINTFMLPLAWTSEFTTTTPAF
jgi:hypothetical protein